MFECLLVFELYKEIEQFLRHRGSGIAGHFENEEFIVSLAYLPDIFSHPNDLNTSIRVTTMYMITARESISACTNKLSICISCTYADFPQLGEVSKGKISLLIVIEIQKHLQVLRQSFQGYFQASARRDFCFTGLDAGQGPFIF